MRAPKTKPDCVVMDSRVFVCLEAMALAVDCPQIVQYPPRLSESYLSAVQDFLQEVESYSAEVSSFLRELR